ncbi:MAG: hypothetical protein HDT20_08740 [Oscillibacter sp.]|nr:hypothetical protein [Oscillibacter sp.]
MKKNLSLCLMLVLLFSLSSAALALEAPNSKTTVTAEPYLPDIKIEVVVPTSGNVYINPLRLPVKVDGKVENKQIISDTFSIENQSEVPLRVDVEVTGKIKRGSDMGLLAKSTAGSKLTTKRAFMYFEIHASSSPSSAVWDSEYDANKHVVVRDSTDKIKKGIVILDSADNAKRFGTFRLTGDCIEEPKEPWNEKDGVEVNIVFSFSPLPVGTVVP